MSKVQLTVTESRCRCGYVKKGDTFLVDDLCPPLCHELWNIIYPSVYVLKNGGSLDYGDIRAKCFDAMCPDEGRVHIHGAVFEPSSLSADAPEHISTRAEAADLSRGSVTHDMKLNPEPFAMIKSGKKTLELRLFDEKRQKIRIGDRIVFTETVTGEKLRARVEGLHRFESFDALYRSLPLLKCGYTEETIADARPSDMEAYYSPEAQKKFGVVGIEISRLRGDPGETV